MIFQLSHEELTKGVIFDKPPPEIEVHIVNAEETWPGLLTVSFEILSYLLKLYFIKNNTYNYIFKIPIFFTKFFIFSIIQLKLHAN